ncbi:MAG: hypothetical protein K1000chlam2_00778 [Chlamydiae bacterium]|nr:hypothetical protein [Chlamydiota bacterium]
MTSLITNFVNYFFEHPSKIKGDNPTESQNTGTTLTSKLQDEINLLNAVRDDRLKTVESLIDRGVSLDIRDGEGNTPLHLSIKTHNLIAMLLLGEKGATVDQKARDLAKEHMPQILKDPINRTILENALQQ